MTVVFYSQSWRNHEGKKWHIFSGEGKKPVNQNSKSSRNEKEMKKIFSDEIKLGEFVIS